MSTNTRARRYRGQPRGQGLTEYVILVALISIFLITAVNKFGGELDTAYQGSASRIENDVGDAINGTGAPTSLAAWDGSSLLGEGFRGAEFNR